MFCLVFVEVADWVRSSGGFKIGEGSMPSATSSFSGRVYGMRTTFCLAHSPMSSPVHPSVFLSFPLHYHLASLASLLSLPPDAHRGTGSA